MKIRIVSADSRLFERQLPNNYEPIKDLHFIFNNVEECDYCFVMDEIVNPVQVKCPHQNLILCVCEPQSVKIYPKSYYKQFGRVASFYHFNGLVNTSLTLPLLPWMAGMKWDKDNIRWNDSGIMDFSQLEKPILCERLDKVVIITSNKCVTRGHRRRLALIERIKEAMPDRVDIFGSGYIPVADKYDVLSKYKYALVIENSIFDNYWTEKLADVLLSECYPIYLGCPNIIDYFNDREMSILGVNDFANAIKSINGLFENRIYENRLQEILSAKNKVLYKYNALIQIADFVSKDKVSYNNLEKQILNINPLKRTPIELLESHIKLRYYQLR